MKVKSESEVAQSCPTISDPRDCSLPGSSVHGIFQARVLEWGAIAFSLYLLSCVQVFATPWTGAHKLLYPWDFPDKNTEVGCHSLLEGTFGTQGLNPGLREGELKCFIRVQLLGWTCIH